MEQAAKVVRQHLLAQRVEAVSVGGRANLVEIQSCRPRLLEPRSDPVDRARMAARANTIGQVTPVREVAEGLKRALERIHQASLTILEQIGVEVLLPEARALQLETRSALMDDAVAEAATAVAAEQACSWTMWAL